jgi:hypothetical protein
MWRAGWGDEELTYKLGRCIYSFFMSALSVFDNFAFCLYFLGHAIKPVEFPEVANPPQHHPNGHHQSIQRRVFTSKNNGTPGGPAGRCEV